MTWFLHHANIPSTGVARDAQFFERKIGLNRGDWTYPTGHGNLHHDDAGIVYYGRTNFGLHVVRPVPGFAAEHGFLHNPTIGGHPAINIVDLPAFVARAKANCVALTDAKTYAMAGIHQTYVMDPSANLIEVNSTVTAFPRECAEKQRADAAVSLVGIILPNHNLPAMFEFYGELIGLGEPAQAPDPSAGVVYRNNAQTILLARPDSRHPARHHPAVQGAVVIGVPDLARTAVGLGAQAHMITDDPLTGEPTAYVLTPSARLLALVQRAVPSADLPLVDLA